MLETTVTPKSRTTRTALILAMLAGVLSPLQASHAAAVHVVNLYGDGNASVISGVNRKADFYVAPGRLQAASGDTIRIVNWGRTKAAAYAPAHAGAPTTLAATVNGNGYDVLNPNYSEFVWSGATTTVTFGAHTSDTAGGTKCPALPTGCSNKLVITTLGPSKPMTIPVITAPTPGAVLGNHEVAFAGHTAKNGTTYRAEIRPQNLDRMPRTYELYGDINGLAEFSGKFAKWWVPSPAPGQFNGGVIDGDWNLTIFSRNFEGYEVKSATIPFTMDAGDHEWYVPNIQPLKYTSSSLPGFSYTHGPIYISGSLSDDKVARKVEVRVARTSGTPTANGVPLLTPMPEQAVKLTCYAAWPPGANHMVPCDSPTNPQMIRFEGWFSPWFGRGNYTFTYNFGDGVHVPSSNPTQSVSNHWG